MINVEISLNKGRNFLNNNIFVTSSRCVSTRLEPWIPSCPEALSYCGSSWGGLRTRRSPAGPKCSWYAQALWRPVPILAEWVVLVQGSVPRNYPGLTGHWPLHMDVPGTGIQRVPPAAVMVCAVELILQPLMILDPGPKPVCDISIMCSIFSFSSFLPPCASLPTLSPAGSPLLL